MTSPIVAPRLEPAPSATPLGVVNMVLGRWKLVALTTFLVASLVVGILFVLPRSYTAVASFVPVSGMRTPPGGLAGLAAQFGVAMPTGGDPARSPSFYVDLIRSRTILGAVADSTYRYKPADEDRVTEGPLSVALRVKGVNPAVERERVIDRLRDLVTAAAIPRTGVINLGVETKDPELSAQILRRILDELAHYNANLRQSQASAERRFVQQRLNQARADMRDAEASLLGFLTQNRSFRTSVELSARHDRLQREVDLQQQVFTSLFQAFEQARIEEVRDTPVLTIIEAPFVPVRPDRRGLINKALFALIGGMVLGIILALAREAFATDIVGTPAERAEFQRRSRRMFGVFGRA